MPAPSKPEPAKAASAAQPIDPAYAEPAAKTPEAKPTAEAGYHDSVSGAAVDANGNYLDGTRKGEDPIPRHRIVADDWPANSA